MFEKIEKKVDDIREEPEHIRIRYVWLAVFVTMFLVIFIWLTSIKTNFTQIQNNPKSQQEIDEIKKRIDDLNPENATPAEKPVSIDDLLEYDATKNEI